MADYTFIVDCHTNSNRSELTEFDNYDDAKRFALRNKYRGGINRVYIYDCKEDYLESV